MWRMKKAKQVNAVLASFHDHMEITTELQDNRLGAAPEALLSSTPVLRI